MVMDERAVELRRYFEDELGWGWCHHARSVFALLWHASEDCRDGAILDAGAGRQRYRPFFDDQCLYLSLEHPSGIEHKGMEEVEYDLLGELDGEIPLDDDCLHGVINTSVLEHVRRPERFVAEAARVLRPGGRVYTHVPFTYPEHEEPYDYQRPTSYALRAWLADAGFEDVAVLPTTSNMSAAVAFVEEALRWDLAETGRIDEFHRLSALAAPVIAELRRTCIDLVHPGTRFPVGWIAVGTVPGVAPANDPVDRAEFLRRHARPNPATVDLRLADGQPASSAVASTPTSGRSTGSPRSTG